MKGVILVLYIICTISFVRTQTDGIVDCEFAVLSLLEPTTIEGIQMFDYTGKALDDMGNYDGCIGMNQSVAHYCVMETIIGVSMASEHLPAYMGLCVPTICTSEDLTKIVAGLLTNPKWNISSRYNLEDELLALQVTCAPGHETKPTVGLVICVALIVILALLAISGTYLETIQTRSVEYRALKNSIEDESRKALLSDEQDPEAHENNPPPVQSSSKKNFTLPLSGSKRSKLILLQDIIKCFGLRSNLKFLLQDNRASEPSLACLNSLRTVGMMWVVLGHTLTYMAAPVGFDNLMTLKDLVGRISFQVVPAAELSVDVFFYLSGFLVVYMLLKEMKTKKGRIPWALFYFHRYVRLTPVYGFVILVYATLTPYLVRGPFHFLFRPTKTDLCDKYWWTNLLYINNFYPTSSSDQCLGWSWYLANDMQFYIFTPLIILAYKKNKRLGWMIVTFLITLCLCLNATLSYIYELVPLDPNNNEFNTIIYNKPYTRMAPYLIGIAAGFLLQEEHIDLSSNKWVRWGGWLIAFITTTSATYLTYGFWRHGWDLLQDVMYMTFARTGFTLATAWLMYSFHKGHGGFLREIASLYFWVPLARLTYTVYLVHPIVIFVINFSTTTTFHYSAIYSGVRYSSNVFIAYVVGLLFHLLVEKPTANIERVLLPPRGGHKK